MDEPAKETVVIVHGTWAMPEPGKTQWYQPDEGHSTADGFVAKLDSALKERGSDARCWAHCVKSDQIFHWSGENSWVARTSAASALADYVAKLRKQRWQCHIIAHSHGGNVVVEALPQIMSASNSHEHQGKIITLGTPFIDTKSQISRTAKRRWSIESTISRVVAGSLGLAILGFILAQAIEAGIADYFSDWAHIAFVFVAFFIMLPLLPSFYPYPSAFLTAVFGDIKLFKCDANAIKSVFLAIGSSMDEIWQILHHM